MGRRLVFKNADFSKNAIDFTGLAEAMAACEEADGKGIVMKVAANSTVQIGYNKKYYGNISRSDYIVDVVNDKDVDYWYFSPSPAGITNVKSLFYGQTALLGIKHVDINGLTDIGQMFYNCAGLKEIDLTDGCIDSATFIYHICDSCTSLEKASFKLKVLTSYSCAEAAFRNTAALSSLMLDIEDASGVLSLKEYMWQQGSGTKLETIDLSMFTNVSTWDNTLYRCTGCTKLKLADGSIFGGDCRTMTRLASLEGNFALAKKNNNSFSASPLTLDSARLVINALPQLESDESYTLTLKATTKSSLAQSDKDAIAAKGWVLA